VDLRPKVGNPVFASLSIRRVSRRTAGRAGVALVTAVGILGAASPALAAYPPAPGPTSTSTTWTGAPYNSTPATVSARVVAPGSTVTIGGGTGPGAPTCPAGDSVSVEYVDISSHQTTDLGTLTANSDGTIPGRSFTAPAHETNLIAWLRCSSSGRVYLVDITVQSGAASHVGAKVSVRVPGSLPAIVSSAFPGTTQEKAAVAATVAQMMSAGGATSIKVVAAADIAHPRSPGHLTDALAGGASLLVALLLASLYVSRRRRRLPA
jgi:hypothetical protein